MKFSIPSEFHQFSPGSVTLANILKWESTHHWQLLHFLLLDNEAVLISSLGAYWNAVHPSLLCAFLFSAAPSPLESGPSSIPVTHTVLALSALSCVVRPLSLTEPVNLNAQWFCTSEAPSLACVVLALGTEAGGGFPLCLRLIYTSYNSPSLNGRKLHEAGTSGSKSWVRGCPENGHCSPYQSGSGQETVGTPKRVELIRT